MSFTLRWSGVKLERRRYSKLQCTLCVNSIDIYICLRSYETSKVALKTCTGQTMDTLETYLTETCLVA